MSLSCNSSVFQYRNPVVSAPGNCSHPCVSINSHTPLPIISFLISSQVMQVEWVPFVLGPWLLGRIHTGAVHLPLPGHGDGQIPLTAAPSRFCYHWSWNGDVHPTSEGQALDGESLSGFFSFPCAKPLGVLPYTVHREILSLWEEMVSLSSDTYDHSLKVSPTGWV